jgi:hypothetical protein
VSLPQMVQSGSVSETQCPAVITIREVSSEPPQNCRWWALPLPVKTTAACHGYWEIEAVEPPTILGCAVPPLLARRAGRIEAASP